MQNQAVKAYQRTGQATATPRDLEAQLLSKSAAQLQRIRNDWDALSEELPGALLFNRKLWTVFLTSAIEEDCPMPMPMRQEVANLGMFVLCQTAELQVAAQPEKLDSLIRINRELAAGLRGSAADRQPSPGSQLSPITPNVIPAKAGTSVASGTYRKTEIPAFAGMTPEENRAFNPGTGPALRSAGCSPRPARSSTHA
jgi:flagellar protein FlaF